MDVRREGRASHDAAGVPSGTSTVRDGGFFRALIPVVVGEAPGVGGARGYGVQFTGRLIILQRFTLVLHTVRHVGTSRECPAVSRVAAPRPRHHRASS